MIPALLCFETCIQLLETPQPSEVSRLRPVEGLIGLMQERAGMLGVLLSNTAAVYRHLGTDTSLLEL